MPDTIKDGGPAFPNVSDLMGHCSGMSVRDVASLVAFHALLTTDSLRNATAKVAEEDERSLPEMIAVAAIDFADAFNAARKGGDNG